MRQIRADGNPLIYLRVREETAGRMMCMFRESFLNFFETLR